MKEEPTTGQILTELRAFRDETRGSIGGLHKSDAEIRGSIEELRGSVGELRKSDVEMRGAIEDLRGSSTVMQGSITSMQGSIVELRGSVEEVRGSVADLTEVVQAFATSVDERFHAVDHRLIRMETTMVTKEYLDDRLGAVKGDLVVLLRKEDAKVDEVIETLERRKGLSRSEARGLLAKSPFPRLRRV